MIEDEIPIDVPCAGCLNGPTGFAGHADLRAQQMGDGRVSMRCTRCESYWLRTLQREGYFDWSAVTERMAHSPHVGIPVPPRATDSILGPLLLRAALT